MFRKLGQSIGAAYRTTVSTVQSWYASTCQVVATVTAPVIRVVSPYWRRTVSALFLASVVCALGCTHAARVTVTGMRVGCQYLEACTLVGIERLRAAKNGTVEKVPVAFAEAQDPQPAPFSWSEMVDRALDGLMPRSNVKIVSAH